MIRLWDVSTGVGARLGAALGEAVESLTVTADGRQVVVGLESGRLVCFALPEAKIIGEWNGHSAWVAGTAFLPDGHTLLSAGGDGAICFWRGVDGEVLLRQEFDVAFSRMALGGEGWLAVGDEDGGVRLLAYPKMAEESKEWQTHAS